MSVSVNFSNTAEHIVVPIFVFLLHGLDCYLTECQMFGCATFILCCQEDNPTHLSLAIPSEACRIRSNRKVKTRNITCANNLCVSLPFIVVTRGLNRVVKYAHHQITDYCNRKTKLLQRPFPPLSLFSCTYFKERIKFVK